MRNAFYIYIYICIYVYICVYVCIYMYLQWFFSQLYTAAPPWYERRGTLGNKYWPMIATPSSDTSAGQSGTARAIPKAEKDWRHPDGGVQNTRTVREETNYASPAFPRTSEDRSPIRQVVEHANCFQLACSKGLCRINIGRDIFDSTPT